MRARSDSSGSRATTAARSSSVSVATSSSTACCATISPWYDTTARSVVAGRCPVRHRGRGLAHVGQLALQLVDPGRCPQYRHRVDVVAPDVEELVCLGKRRQGTVEIALIRQLPADLAQCPRVAEEITGRDEEVGGAACVAQRLVVVAELVQRVGQIAEHTSLADHVVHRPVGQSLLWCHLAASQPRVF